MPATKVDYFDLAGRSWSGPPEVRAHHVQAQAGSLCGKILYRFRTRCEHCDLRFGRKDELRQDRGLCLFACST
jgi:hypothetical protein